MRLRELGERRIIQLFTGSFKKDRCRELLVASGDDCAVYKLGDGRLLLLSTDTVLEGTHLPREMTPEQIGSYAVNVTLSDVAAMGGRPLCLVFSVVLRPELEEGFALRLARGMEKAAMEHGTCIAGGDTQEGERLSIAGVALGMVQENRLLLRSTASVGELICVTGEIGSAAAGFYCLTRGLGGRRRLIARALEPKARLLEAQLLSRAASSCMDISDGLALTVHEIASQSGVGAVLYEENLPVDPEVYRVAEELDIPAREMTLYHGGDFELLFTVSKRSLPGLVERFREHEREVHVIGEVTEGRCRLVAREGGVEELERRGWQSFSNKDI